jgi:hypothetical protein
MILILFFRFGNVKEGLCMRLGTETCHCNGNRSRRDRTPDDPNEKKIREYVKSLPEDARRKLDEEEDRAERSLLLMQVRGAYPAAPAACLRVM